MPKRSARTSRLPTLINVNAFITAPFHFNDRPIFKRRWEEWEPWVLLDLRRKGTSSPRSSVEFERLKNAHREALAILLRVGVAMRTVRRNELDDPRIGEDERTERIWAWMERRSRHLSSAFII